MRPRFVFRLSHLPFCQMGTKKGQHKNGCPDGRRDTRLLPVGTPTFRQLQPSRTCVLHTLYHSADKMSMPEGQKPLFLHILQKNVGYPASFCLRPICPVLLGVMKPSRPAGHITRRSLISLPKGISRIPQGIYIIAYFCQKTHKLPPRVKLSPYSACLLLCRDRRPRRSVFVQICKQSFTNQADF